MALSNAVKILDTLEITPQLAWMEKSLREKTEKPVLYVPLTAKTGEPGLPGLYKYDQKRGNIIELEKRELTEYTVAHELAHGLMRADGFVSAGFIDSDEKLEQVAVRIRAAVLHPSMSAYLASFSFRAAHERFYREHVRHFADLQEEIAHIDDQTIWGSIVRALEFVEIAVIVSGGLQQLESMFSKSAPRIWQNTVAWLGVLMQSDFNSAFGCREATVALVKKLDSWLSQVRVEYSLLGHLVIPWIFRHPEAQQPALSIFRLDAKQVEESCQGFLHYLRDESVVLRLGLEGMEEVPVLLNEWRGTTASELIVRLEGKTPWNSLGTLS